MTLKRWGATMHKWRCKTSAANTGDGNLKKRTGKWHCTSKMVSFCTVWVQWNTEGWKRKRPTKSRNSPYILLSSRKVWIDSKPADSEISLCIICYLFCVLPLASCEGATDMAFSPSRLENTPYWFSLWESPCVSADRLADVYWWVCV